ncbi:MAG: CPBP family intramembrane metalloprotease [Lachnospiraceae bacterium]|nr:CPBP family intramembrane metalloprotease [Lachnospiraceae bacterium]
MLEQNKKGFKIFIILLLAYMAVHVLYTKILLRFFDMPMQFSVMLQIISYLVLGSVGVVLFWNELKEGISLWKKHTGKTLGLFLVAYVLDILLSNLAFFPIMYLNPEYQSLNEHSVAELQGKFPALLLIIALGIMGPVAEEVVFRLAPISLTEKKSKRIIVVLVAAVLFMLVHMHAFTVEEFLYNLPHFVTGSVYGIVMVLSRNVTIPILLHIMNNLPAIVLATLYVMN